MRDGILKRKEGFEIRNHIYRIRIPQGTRVFFSYSQGVPTISFENFDIKLMKISGEWFANVYGCLMLMEFDRENPPYPILFFEKKKT